MKKMIVALLFILCGCSSGSTVAHMADSIKDELSLIAEEFYSLPPECGDKTKLGQRIELTIERVDILEESYMEITDTLVQETRRLELYVFILSAVLLALGVLLARRLLSRVFQ